MKGYSKQMAGVLVAVGGILLVQFGFSEACSGEITSKLLPLAGAVPGLAITWFGRVFAGKTTPADEVNVLGFKK